MEGGVSADTPLFFIPGTGQAKGFSRQVSFVYKPDKGDRISGIIKENDWSLWINK